MVDRHLQRGGQAEEVEVVRPEGSAHTSLGLPINGDQRLVGEIGISESSSTTRLCTASSF
jgi:hypothetical protein